MNLIVRNLSYLADYLNSREYPNISYEDKLFVERMVARASADRPLSDEDVARISLIRAKCAGRKEAAA